jgi:hypothetical protein
MKLKKSQNIIILFNSWNDYIHWFWVKWIAAFLKRNANNESRKSLKVSSKTNIVRLDWIRKFVEVVKPENDNFYLKIKPAFYVIQIQTFCDKNLKRLLFHQINASLPFQSWEKPWFLPGTINCYTILSSCAVTRLSKFQITWGLRKNNKCVYLSEHLGWRRNLFKFATLSNSHIILGSLNNLMIRYKIILYHSQTSSNPYGTSI